ncbi:MAG: putative metal-binding motif-containing protein [Deltaproteobacteria bacterium]|nr:putative metal-binding motif-containing protein [Deltaproteobacteria bacterium]
MRWEHLPAAALLVLVASCGDAEEGLGDGSVRLGADASSAIACSSDDACPFGQVCREGLCHPSDGLPADEGCWRDEDCPSGLVCAVATGQCVTSPRLPEPPPVETGTCSTGATRQCGQKVGACDYGLESCVAGDWSGVCEGSVEPSPERCNRADDDCNGREDDGFFLGLPCSAGVGVCERAGLTVCSTDGSTVACSETGLDPSGRVELCANGFDDNCDGQTDEGFTDLGSACTAGVGACRRSGVVVCSSDAKSTACSASPGTASPAELCGGAPDDDCDGQNEEGFTQVGQACTAGVGACERSGVWVCSADQRSVRCSATQGTPGPVELCSTTVDDNCNGQTNEGFANLGQPCTVGTAPCQQQGTWACGPDGASLICGVTTGGTELCNGRDDDADTCVDEGFNLGVSCATGVGACRRTGTTICNGSGSGTTCNATAGTPAPAELCGNSVDDNCNGSTDEGFTNLGDACAAGAGACLRSGVYVCSTDLRTTTCDAVAGTPAPAELCGNGIDDNCNGSIDEGFVNLGQSCATGSGICRRTGTYLCSADGRSTVCSATAGTPAPAELCGNSLDDDCDGSTDEGFNVGTACTAGLGICARNGTNQCSADRLSTVCSAMPGAAGPAELCSNSLDDDCDGFTDEGFANLGQSCAAGVGACRRTGTYVCSTDRLTTVCGATAGTATAESCNNADDDCNGTNDNGCDDDNDDYCDAAMSFPLGATTLITVCPLTNAVATRDCNDSDGAINPGAMEICNDARDQNCDGNLNDGCPVCNPSIDADFDGSNACNDCDETNGSIRPGATERCNGVDDDCDGTLDEGFDGDGDTYTTCGTVRPGGGLDPAWVDCDDTNASRRPFACELCALGSTGNTVACGAANDRGNTVDEDCDGYVDETCSPCSTADPDGDGVSECDGDCAPSDGQVAPSRPELCDGRDNDCNTRTTENCDVGDRCNWPGTPAPDTCRDRLICVESLGPGGQRTGNFTCTSFCNRTPLGLGLGDGCTANQTCASPLTPTANLHGCAVSTDIGTGAVGASCSDGAQCRSGNCLRDQRLAGPPVRYCSDLCGSDAYCGGGTNCQVWGSFTGQCWRTLSLQNRGTGVACNDTNTACRGGPSTCVQISAGNRICSAICCHDADCPTGYFCSLRGNDAPGPAGGYDTVPVCWPEGAGTHDRLAGAACTSNGQCRSEFCDRNLRVCAEVCCHDSDCPTGLACESTQVERGTNRISFARMCLNLAPASPLQAMP